MTKTDAIKKLFKDVIELKKETKFLKEILLKVLSEKENKNVTNVITDSDTWDPSCGPRPKNMGKKGVATFQKPNDAGVHTHITKK